MVSKVRENFSLSSIFLVESLIQMFCEFTFFIKFTLLIAHKIAVLGRKMS